MPDAGCRDEGGRTPAQAALLEYGEVKLAASESGSCECCKHQDAGGHYCNLRGEGMGNMNLYSCRAWQEAEQLKQPASPWVRKLMRPTLGEIAWGALAWLVKGLLFWPILLVLDASLWAIAGREFRTLEIWRAYRRETHRALFGKKGVD